MGSSVNAGARLTQAAKRQPRRVALVHDWLTGMRGGEMVLLELCRMFPAADLFTLLHIPGSVDPLIENRRIFQSPLAKLPAAPRFYRHYLPIFPWAIETFDLGAYDLIISSSHCVAKGVIDSPSAVHISYVHSPMRYIWDVRGDYFGRERNGALGRFIIGWAAHYLRMWDVTSSTRVDRFIANSNFIAARIRKYYRREAVVVYPPVDLGSVASDGGEPEDYFITVSELVPYKRVDLAVSACSRLGLKLKVVGGGPEYRRLKGAAGRTVEFTGRLRREELAVLYRRAAALIHPAVEDFGIAPVEAQAAGRPVIAFGAGGCLETVIGDGAERTGAFFYEQTVEALTAVLRDFNPAGYSPAAARTNAERFGRERFVVQMGEIIQQVWGERH